MAKLKWIGTVELPSEEFKCGFCGHSVASVTGIGGASPGAFSGNYVPMQYVFHRAYLCPNCNCVSMWHKDKIISPLPSFGESVGHLPEDVRVAYEEARSCMRVGAYTAAVLLCRKLLMHVSVEKGADEGKQFVVYVNFLNDRGYIPPDGRAWVDYIRLRGNEATHELASFDRESAENVLIFTAALLRNVYELPGRLPPPPSATTP